MNNRLNSLKHIGTWVVKSKFYHLFFWAIYQYLWWALYEGSTLRVFNNLLLPPVGLKFFFYVVIQTIGIYFCLYYLIPKFLEKRKYILFLSLVSITILIMALFILGGYYFSTWFFGYNVYDFFGFTTRTPFHIFKTQALPSAITVMAFGMSIKLAKNYLEAQQKQQVLEKEKLETELKFLKSQFNPHFLFNTINSIFVLIGKNPTMATESLAKFSELLRYQLYECNEPEIPLDREINYLESFIKLEKLRQNENFELQTTLLENTKTNLVIAPFLLMPFIENAFKHVSTSRNTLNWIKLQMFLQENKLTFKICNSIEKNTFKSREAVTYSGLGLKNVKRRLDLVYNTKYQLIINELDTSFEIKLILDLKDSKEPNLKLVVNA